MSAALAWPLLLAAAAPVPLGGDAPASADDTPEIVVLAHNLDRVSFNYARDLRGEFRCEAVQSTGDAKLDAKLCKAIAQCIRRDGWGDAVVEACLKKRKADLVADARASLLKRRVRQAELAQGDGG